MEKSKLTVDEKKEALYFLFAYNKKGLLPMTSHLHVRLQQEIFLDKLKDKIQATEWGEEEKEFLIGLIETQVQLVLILQEKNISLKRLKDVFFGSGTEKLPHSSEKEKSAHPNNPPERSPKRREKYGRQDHKKNPTVQRHVPCPLTSLTAGDRCPGCQEGRLYSSPPAQKTCIRSVSVISVEVYELEKLRCRLCEHTETASLPQALKESYGKYHASSIAHLANLRYFYGMPSHRIKEFTKYSGLSVPDTTQFRLFEYAAHCALPVFRCLQEQAANGKTIYRDDSPMRVILLKREQERKREEAKQQGKNTKEVRVSISTTHLHALTYDGNKIALYSTGLTYAGEEYEKLLQKRTLTREKVLAMSDASALNHAHKSEKFTNALSCLIHARRYFYVLQSFYPNEINPILELFRVIYKNENQALTEQLNEEQRLIYHIKHSSPAAKKLLKLAKQGAKKHPPNSSLYRAYNYIQKHWRKLAGFLRFKGAPLDNNICEQGIKFSIRHRKNSLFYRSTYGAWVGDVLMSLLKTCAMAGCNPIEYLTQLLIHSQTVRANPMDWLPWNYNLRKMKEAI